MSHDLAIFIEPRQPEPRMTDCSIRRALQALDAKFEERLTAYERTVAMLLDRIAELEAAATPIPHWSPRQ